VKAARTFPSLCTCCQLPLFATKKNTTIWIFCFNPFFQLSPAARCSVALFMLGSSEVSEWRPNVCFHRGISSFFFFFLAVTPWVFIRAKRTVSRGPINGRNSFFLAVPISSVFCSFFLSIQGGSDSKFCKFFPLFPVFFCPGSLSWGAIPHPALGVISPPPFLDRTGAFFLPILDKDLSPTL